MTYIHVHDSALPHPTQDIDTLWATTAFTPNWLGIYSMALLRKLKS